MNQEVTQMGQMNQEQALGILVSAVKIGQSKGAYTIEDAAVIAQAIALFTPKDAPVAEAAQAGEVTEDAKEVKDEK